METEKLFRERRLVCTFLTNKEISFGKACSLVFIQHLTRGLDLIFCAFKMSVLQLKQLKVLNRKMEFERNSYLLLTVYLLWTQL